MAKFRFKLDPVLAMRERVERDRQAQLGAVQAERQALESQLREIQTQIREGKDQWRASLAGHVDARAARQTAVASLHLQARAQRLVLQLAGVLKRLETARVALVEASRERRTVELLKEKRRTEWERAMSKAEDAAVDDLAVLRAGRKSA
jgi:flagellar FliJ protein